MGGSILILYYTCQENLEPSVSLGLCYLATAKPKPCIINEANPARAPKVPLVSAHTEMERPKLVGTVVW